MASSAASPASEQATPVQVRVLLLLMAFGFLCHFNRVGMSVVGTEKLVKAPAKGGDSKSASSEEVVEPEDAAGTRRHSGPESREIAFTPRQMGVVYSSYLLIYTLMMIPGGWLIDRVGPRNAMGLMGLGSATLVVLTGLPGWGIVPSAGALAAFIGVRGCLGLFTVPMHPGAARMVSLTFPPTICSWANGMVTGAAVFGIASTFYLFGLLMDELGWPAVFLISGLATLVVTALWLIAVPSGSSSHVADSPSGDQTKVSAALAPDNEGAQRDFGGFITEMMPLLRNRSLVLVTISYGAFGYFQYLFFYWMQYYFDDTLGMSKSDGRLYATIPTVAMAFGMIGGGWLSDRLQHVWGVRWGRASLQIVTMLGAALFALVGVNLSDPVSVDGCFALAMGLLGMSEGPFWSTAVDLGGRRGGLAAAIFNTGGNVGGTLAPYLTPVIGGQFGWQYAIGLACLFCLIGAVLWLWIDPGDSETTG